MTFSHYVGILADVLHPCQAIFRDACPPVCPAAASALQCSSFTYVPLISPLIVKMRLIESIKISSVKSVRISRFISKGISAGNLC